jgi:S1-C subfamily serine protease
MFTDALGDHGQSGSPGLNSDGEIVGVMSLINGDARPFAFLVPLKNLKEFLSTY